MNSSAGNKISEMEEQRFHALAKQMPIWTQGKARCSHCQHVQHSVHVAGTLALECARCARMEARPIR